MLIQLTTKPSKIARLQETRWQPDRFRQHDCRHQERTSWTLDYPGTVESGAHGTRVPIQHALVSVR